MSERIDRDALIAAAKEAAQARGWITEWTTVAAMVDAVVPLIADALAAKMNAREAKANVETDQKRAEQLESEADGLLCATALMRSFLRAGNNNRKGTA
jgi:hypothetical protein